MKFKDIEKNLKKENDSINVPDVFDSVKSTPINRLLTGETPIQAFKKKLVLQVMAFAIIILIVAFVAFAALALTEPKSTMGPDSYVSISILSGDKYGFIVGADGTVKLAVKEKDGGSDVYAKIDNVAGNDIKNAIKYVYAPNSTDKISIYVTCDKNDLGRYWRDEVTNDVIALFIGVSGYPQITSMASYDLDTITYINTKVEEGNKVSAASSAEDIIAAYTSLFEG